MSKLSAFILILSTQFFLLEANADMFSTESSRNLISLLFNWSEFKVTVPLQTKKIMNEGQYFIFTHSANIWDFERSSLNGVQKMISVASKANIKRIAFMSTRYKSKQIAFPDYYYFSPDQINLVADSKNGEHKLQFPNAKKIFLAGGYLNQCLCETLRDIIYEQKKYKAKSLKFYIVRDAVYNRNHRLRGPVHNLEDQLTLNFQQNKNKQDYFILNNYAEDIQGCWKDIVPSVETEKTDMRFYLDEEYVYSFSSTNKEYYYVSALNQAFFYSSNRSASASQSSEVLTSGSFFKT